jgi:hypothetical protein
MTVIPSLLFEHTVSLVHLHPYISKEDDATISNTQMLDPPGQRTMAYRTHRLERSLSCAGCEATGSIRTARRAIPNRQAFSSERRQGTFGSSRLVLDNS